MNYLLHTKYLSIDRSIYLSIYVSIYLCMYVCMSVTKCVVITSLDKLILREGCKVAATHATCCPNDAHGLVVGGFTTFPMSSTMDFCTTDPWSRVAVADACNYRIEIIINMGFLYDKYRYMQYGYSCSLPNIRYPVLIIGYHFPTQFIHDTHSFIVMVAI